MPSSSGSGPLESFSTGLTCGSHRARAVWGAGPGEAGRSEHLPWLRAGAVEVALVVATVVAVVAAAAAAVGGPECTGRCCGSASVQWFLPPRTLHSF